MPFRNWKAIINPKRVFVLFNNPLIQQGAKRAWLISHMFESRVEPRKPAYA